MFIKNKHGSNTVLVYSVFHSLFAYLFDYNVDLLDFDVFIRDNAGPQKSTFLHVLQKVICVKNINKC